MPIGEPTRTTSMRFVFGYLGLILIVGLGLGLSGGCGGDGGGDGSGATISTGPLAGKIGGQAWSLGTAQSDAFLSDADTLFVTMYPTTFTACEAFNAPTGMNEVIVLLPRTVGSYNLSLAMNATLYDASTMNNLIAIQGRIVIDSVTATTISGGANIRSNADNAVDGQFQATICP